MKQLVIGLLLLLTTVKIFAQPTFPINGVADEREKCYAFINAKIVVSPTKSITNGTLVIRKGFIEQVGNNITIPEDAVVVDCANKFIYPSFIDLYSNYGCSKNIENTKNNTVVNNAAWNPAMHSNVNALDNFKVNSDQSKALRNIGFGAVLTHLQDGISRGTGLLTTLQENKENLVVLKNPASAHYSFKKGSSTYDYPNSLMGSIALLRQNFLDAQWFKNNPTEEGYNAGLKAFNDNANLPQIFEANDKWNDLRANKIGEEFNVKYIIKGDLNEFERIAEIKKTNTSYILPINWPATMDVEDPLEAYYVNLGDMKRWEMAPSNLVAFYKNNIPFCITTTGLKDKNIFFANIKKSIQLGLPDSIALAALTTTPATIIKAQDKIGTLEKNKVANFFICSNKLFEDDNVIYQNWIQGQPYDVKADGWHNYSAQYKLVIDNTITTLNINSNGDKHKALIIAKDTTKCTVNINGELVALSYILKPDTIPTRLSGVIINDKDWRGKGVLPNGKEVVWYLQKLDSISKKDSVKKNTNVYAIEGTLTYPNIAYGNNNLPLQEKILIKNVTVWTNEKEGILTNCDVLIDKGKIKKVGKNISEVAKIIDGTNKHLTAGIIDEHSHIAITGGVNECSQSVTAEVRVGDVLNPDDVNIYRQLSGGVTTSHLLHGSCNAIGGQTQLIKLRWGANAESLKYQPWDPQIKFALGENVKKSNNGGENNRYPDSRMGVYQVLHDAFTRAKDYELQKTNKRKDLELEALSNILNKKLFITCHSYVQSEINALIKIADSFGFTVNTFTHILEGYKVADKMKQHGASASTFSDWWAYKMEVQDAIPQNAYLMQQVGLNVAINSDDAEMARRLNQEAAKSIKYANMDEQEALKMVTLNPAKMLHIADKVGSVQEGKDADIVLWSDNPLSIYAKALYTLVDGIIYFDRAKDLDLRKDITQEKARLVAKMVAGKKAGQSTVAPKIMLQQEDFCEDDHHPRNNAN